MYTTPVHIQVLLAQKFNISLDWLILDKGPMYRDRIEAALRNIQENISSKNQENKILDWKKIYGIIVP